MADRARLKLIEDTLATAIAQQRTGAVAGLDLGQIAAAIERALSARAPLDPEGDGLESSELNAANDI